LRSSTDNEYFNSFGAGSTKIGSLGVVTVNLPRLAYLSEAKEDFIEKVRESTIAVAKINHAKRNIIKKRIDLNSMPLYSLGHMDLSKQYSTYGVTGLNEALISLGYDILSEEGEQFVLYILDAINEENDKMAKRFKSPHNCEQVPAESSAVKLAKRDRTLKYQDKYVLYSNQFIPLTKQADMLDRLRLQGKFDSKFSGGAICHVNVGEKIKDRQTLIDLMIYAAKCGVVYWAVNYALKRCVNSHVFVDEDICPFCGEGIDHVSTRVVGFFTNVNNWNEMRRNHDWKNRQFYKDVK
jgi:ribonucleoside-triphosphate reductase